MAYSKQTWVRGEKVASVKLNHMEDGIEAISANGAIDTANLAPAAVKNEKIDQEAVDSDNIRTGAIITPLIYDGAVTLPKLGADVIAELDNKADIDGSYESMTVGNAEQLVSSVGIEEQTPYNFRTSGGSTEIGDREELNAVVGVSVPWNQLVPTANRNFTSESSDTRALLFVLRKSSSPYTTLYQKQNVAVGILSSVVASSFDGYAEMTHIGSQRNIRITPVDGFRLTNGHKYLFSLNFTAVDTSTVGGVVAKDISVHDLTFILGSTIADYIYALEYSNAGAGVAYFKKLFPKPYYAYNAGSLLSVKTSAHKMVGFNLYNKEDAVSGRYIGPDGSEESYYTISHTGYIKAIPNTVYYVLDTQASANVNLFANYDADKNFIGWSPSYNGDGHLRQTLANTAYVIVNILTSVIDTQCINLHWSGARDGEYKAYQEWNYPLDGTKEWRGILRLDANNNLYADGDIYPPSGEALRRYTIVDLGEIAWSGNASSNGHFTGTLSTNTLAPYKWASNTLMVCGAYVFDGYGASGIGYFGANGTFRYYYAPSGSQPREIYVCDESKSSMTPTQFKAAMSGIYLVYELETPTTESADPYQQTQNVSDWGTEEYVDERDVAIPVGNVTFYPQNLRKKIEGLPFDFSTLIARTEKAFKATRAYAVNEFLIINNQLYKTRTSIANGATITVGTNVIATTIGAELTAILNS